VPIDDYRACRRFIERYPKVLQESNLKGRYVGKAVQLLVKGDPESKSTAFNYMAKYALIRAIHTYPTRQKDFLELLIRRDTDAVETFEDAFSRLKRDCKNDADRTRARDRDRREPQRSIDQSDTDRTRARDRDRREPQRPIDQGDTADAVTRMQSLNINTSDRRPAVPTDRHSEPLPNRHANPQRHSQKVQGEEQWDEETEGVSTPRPRPPPAPSLPFDERFQRLRPREWHYFKTGCVFATIALTEDSSRLSSEDGAYESIKSHSTRGMAVSQLIRYWCIVSARDAFCLVVPINTYGGRGLLKAGFRQRNIEAHARIYMSNKEPVWLDGEPRVQKRDIIVHPASSQHTLHPASRICFERTHSIDYNERIMKVGTITEDCLEYLLHYWEEETSRGSSNRFQQQRRHERRY
jgi:hypothetical protein